MLRSAVAVIHVSVFAAGERFFNHLGFRKDFEYRPDPTKADPCYAGFTRDAVTLHVSSFRDGSVGGAVYIYVDDVDAVHRELVASGVTIDSGPVDQTWGTREVWVRDADRNVVTFGQLRS